MELLRKLMIDKCNDMIVDINLHISAENDRNLKRALITMAAEKKKGTVLDWEAWLTRQVLEPIPCSDFANMATAELLAKYDELVKEQQDQYDYRD